jgi:hypothetical protein
MTLTDPRTRFAQPDTSGRTQPQPGLTGRMDVRPDHGEESYRGSGKLAGRRALITGGDSGIGRAVAIAFAREGADVAIAHLPSEAEDAAETLRLTSGATPARDVHRRRPHLPGSLRADPWPSACRASVAWTSW